VPPGRKGLRYFMYGIDDSAFQSHREQLLEVGRNGIIDAAQTYALNQSAFLVFISLFSMSTLHG